MKIEIINGNEKIIFSDELYNNLVIGKCKYIENNKVVRCLVKYAYLKGNSKVQYKIKEWRRN